MFFASHLNSKRLASRVNNINGKVAGGKRTKSNERKRGRKPPRLMLIQVVNRAPAGRYIMSLFLVGFT